MFIVQASDSVSLKVGRDLRSLLPYFEHKPSPVPTMESSHAWNQNPEEFIAQRLSLLKEQKLWKPATVLSIAAESKNDHTPWLLFWPGIDENFNGKNKKSQVLNLLGDSYNPEELRKFVFDSFRENLLQQWKSWNLPENVFPKWWNAMTETHRWYHTPIHIFQMMCMLEAWKDKIKCKEAMALAIFFHDIVYETSYKDYQHNEDRSSSLLWTWMKDSPEEWRVSIPERPSILSIAATHIQTTKQHTLSSWYNAYPEFADDCQILLDLDLTIFASKNGLKHFESSIRNEWSHIDEKEFQTERRKVLLKFYEMEKIYHSKELDFLNQQAKQNLKKILVSVKE